MGEHMTCTDFQNLIVVGIHGRLTAEERRQIDRHRSACGECAALYDRFADLIEQQAESLEEGTSAAAPEWDKSLAAIEEEAFPERRPFFRFLDRVPRWVPATAAILLVFVLGYFAGRSILVDSITSRSGIAALPSSEFKAPLIFASYADNLKPVLISFLNRGDVVPPEELRALELEIIRDMLSRTRILRDLASKTGDIALGDLLFDLEFILTSMANLAPGDRDSAALLERMIREKDVTFRLRELASPATI
jgi:hypothetical protein